MKTSPVLASLVMASLGATAAQASISFPGVAYSENFDAALGAEWTLLVQDNNGTAVGTGWQQAALPSGGVAQMTGNGGGDGQIRPSSGGSDDSAFGGAAYPLAPIVSSSSYNTLSGGVFSGGWLQQVGVGNAVESVPASGVFDQTNDGIARLEFTDLGSHTSIDLDVLVAAGGSWDGGTSNANHDGPFDILIDGVSMFNHFFNNGGATLDGSPGVSTFFTNGNVNGHYREQWQDNGGAGPANDADRFNISWTMDSAYDLGGVASLTEIPHTADTLTVEFVHRLNSNQSDEQIGLENLSIGLNGVPEPSVSLLVALGGALILRRRRL